MEIKQSSAESSEEDRHHSPSPLAQRKEPRNPLLGLGEQMLRQKSRPAVQRLLSASKGGSQVPHFTVPNPEGLSFVLPLALVNQDECHF